jgi:ribosome-binding protein aMBF1 (putative translation factor)
MMKHKVISPRGHTWDEVEKKLCTPEEIAECDLKVALIGELIKARREQGISQRKLEEMSGVKQPVIARMEKGSTTPRIGTVIKVLASLGKKLTIVPMEQEEVVH